MRARGVICTPFLPSPGGGQCQPRAPWLLFPHRVRWLPQHRLCHRPEPGACLLTAAVGWDGAPGFGVSPRAPGLQSQVLLGHSGPTLSRTLMNSFLYVAAGPRAHVRARMCVLLVGHPRGRTSPAPRNWKHPLPGCAGAAWEVEAGTERGAPALGRSEAVYAEMGGSGGGRES